LRSPFGLIAIACAVRRKDNRADSLPTASRNSGTGKVGTPR
jgi:hypothetical protein